MNGRGTVLLAFLSAAGGAGAAPGPLPAAFEEQVLPFLESYCFECHDEATRKGDFSVEGLDPDLLNGGDLEAWRLVWDQVRHADMPPPTKDQPPPNERDAALAWVRGELLKTQGPGLPVDPKLELPQFGNYVDHEALFGERHDYVRPAPPRLWRLRPAIYDAVLPRLAERVEGLANGLSEADGPVLKDYASRYFIDEASTRPLLENAKKVAASLIGPHGKDRSVKALVEGDAAPPRELVREAIEATFHRALGRAASKEELERFAAFHERASGIGGREAGASALITAILMQPEFLFRQELGDGVADPHGRVRLAPREIAYALSFALDNGPLPEFLRAAETGGLAEQEGIRDLVRERLQDDSPLYERNPRILQFFREYFDFPNAAEVFKDRPEGGDHDAARLIGDLELTIINVLRRDRRVLAELLTTRDYYVNAKFGTKERSGQLEPRHQRRDKYHTAFNLPLDWKWSAEDQPLRFPSDERAGVLTHPAWLVAWSGNFENHPVQRGKWIRTHLLGGWVPDVPIGVDARVPEGADQTFRQRLHSATSAAECWRCHKSMDPLGLAFERYDHYGRYQRFEAGQPVDPSAAISRTPVPALHREFDGPVAMLEFLARSEYVEQVFVRHVFRYFMGRNETLGDANTLQDAHRAYRESDGSFNELVVSLLSSESFLLRQSVTDPTSQ